MRAAPPLSALPRYPVTGGLALLAIGVTIAWHLKVNLNVLMTDATVARGQLWRLATATLPHVNAFHLIFNVYWLWVFGTLVEETWGSARAALIVLLLAAGSTAAEYAIFEGGVGLSGVGYGLFGLLWALGLHDGRFRDVVDRNTTTLFVAWFFLCIVTTITNVLPVGNVAHGMGAVLGVLLGMAIAVPRRRAAWTAVLAATVATCVAGATLLRPYANLDGDGGAGDAYQGYQALGRGDDEQAVWWYRRAVAYRNVDPRWHFNLGVSYLRTGRSAEAAAAFARASQIAPGNDASGAQANPATP